jgi:glycosyltransferase involved in cell wall biosynthesis
MKVLIVSSVFPPMKSGGADYVLRMSAELAKLDVTVHVLTAYAKDKFTTLPRGVFVHEIMKSWCWPDAFQLLGLVREIKPDVVHLIFTGWMYHDHPMITFLPHVLKRLAPGIRVVTCIESVRGVNQELSTESTRYVQQLMSKWAGQKGINYEYGTIARDSDRIIFLSDRHKTLVKKEIAVDESKCVLIPPPPIMPMSKPLDAAAREALKRELKVPPDEFVLGHYGYLYPNKGIEFLFEAISALGKKGRKPRLLIVGGTPEQYVLDKVGRPNYLAELKELAAKLGIADNVTWIPYVPFDSDDASLCLRLADICTLPYEWGVSLNNSSLSFCAAHGLPIVTTRPDDLEHPFVHEQNLLLCKPRDTESLLQSIERLMDDGALRQKLSAGALALTDEWFSWPSAMNKTMTVYGFDSLCTGESLKTTPFAPNRR